MSKKVRIIAVALALVLATGAFILKNRMPERPASDTGEISAPVAGRVPAEDAPSAADAIPAESDTRSNDDGLAKFFMSTSDTESFSSLMSLLMLPVLAAPPKSVAPQDFRDTFDFMMKFLSSADEFSVYAENDRGFNFYASMFMDEGKLGEFIAEGNGRFLRVEQMEASIAGPDSMSWMLRPMPLERSGDVVYMTERRSRGRNLVSFAPSPDAVSAMNLAWDDPSKRFAYAKNIDGENFVKMKFKTGEPAQPGGADSIAGELSWSRTDSGVHIRTFTDAADYYMWDLPTASSFDFAPSKPVIIGDGELALFSCVDPFFTCRFAFPEGNDPVNQILDHFPQIPAMLRTSLAAILKRSRIYAAVTTKGDVLRTAYVMLESDERTAVNALYGLASLPRWTSVKIDGWDSAYRISSKDIIGGVMLGRRGNFVILGVGDPAAYGMTGELPPEMRKIASPSNAFGISASSAILSVKIGENGETVGRHIEKSMLERGVRFDAADLKKIDSFSWNETPDGRGEIYITFKELEK